MYTSRILTCISSTESSLAISMNVVLAPIFVAVQFGMDGWSSSPDIVRLVWMIINEMVVVGIIFMSISTMRLRLFSLTVGRLWQVPSSLSVIVPFVMCPLCYILYLRSTQRYVLSRLEKHLAMRSVHVYSGFRV